MTQDKIRDGLVKEIAFEIQGEMCCECEPPCKCYENAGNAAADWIISRDRRMMQRIADKLGSIVEYWNMSENSTAMADACRHNIETAEEVIIICKEYL